MYDIKRLRHQARGFQIAFERCACEGFSESTLLYPPSVVCISLACEIYLKAIYYFENPESSVIKKHNLLSLFEMIDGSYKERISSQLAPMFDEESLKEALSHIGRVFE